MKIFADDRGRCVALFGGGLIGSSIGTALCRRSDWQTKAFHYAWTDPVRRHADLEAITAALVGQPSDCHLIWAAGEGGFGSSRTQMADEVVLVEELLGLADRLRQKRARVVFHLVSSAGGLFEGQTHISCHTASAPLRPYGWAKLEQENRLLLRPEISAQIYRPSSVYGFSPGGRRGLFAKLIANVLSNRCTLISGTERTIRDYVCVNDIGAFIAGRVDTRQTGNATYLLASGKPTTMFEVLSMIERLLGRPVYRRFETKASNSLDLSFAPNSLPMGWRPTPLGIGLAALSTRIHAAMVRRARAGASRSPRNRTNP